MPVAARATRPQPAIRCAGFANASWARPQPLRVTQRQSVVQLRRPSAAARERVLARTLGQVGFEPGALALSSCASAALAAADRTSSSGRTVPCWTFWPRSTKVLATLPVGFAVRSVRTSAVSDPVSGITLGTGLSTIWAVVTLKIWTEGPAAALVELEPWQPMSRAAAAHPNANDIDRSAVGPSRAQNSIDKPSPVSKTLAE